MENSHAKEKENYVWLSTHLRFNIAVQATHKEIIKELNFDLFSESSWEESEKYIYSYLKDCLYNETAQVRYVNISPPINNWRLLSFLDLHSYGEAIAICQKLSSYFGEACLFYQDAYIDFDCWCICENGQVVSMVTRNEERLEIKGMLRKAEKEYIEKHHYSDWDMEEFLSAHFFNIKEAQKPSELYKMKSQVCIVKEISTEFDDSKLPKEIINICDDEGMENVPDNPN